MAHTIGFIEEIIYLLAKSSSAGLDRRCCEDRRKKTGLNSVRCGCVEKRNHAEARRISK
jgi:hypothetical protein